MSNLKGCYDRIVHNAAALALLRIGVSKAKIHSMFDTIQRIVHRIRTGFGDATETYGGDDIMDWQFTPKGVLQGNASGPTIWSVLSSVIFEILHDKGFGVEFCSTISWTIVILYNREKTH
jgi:hypothetical protein